MNFNKSTARHVLSRCPIDVVARAVKVVLNASEVTVPDEVGSAFHAHQEAFDAEGNFLFSLDHPSVEVVYEPLDLHRRCDIELPTQQARF